MPQAAMKPWTSEGIGDDENRRAVARSMIAARRALNGPLPSGMLHDAALDILLRLFVEGTVTVGDLHADIGIAPSVLRRWLAALEHDDLILSSDRDAVLSDKGHAALVEALDAVVQSQVDLFGSAVHA